MWLSESPYGLFADSVSGRVVILGFQVGSRAQKKCSDKDFKN